MTGIGRSKLVNLNMLVEVRATIKRHFYACEKIMQIDQNEPLENFTLFLFMCLTISCIVMYGTIAR